MESDSKGEKPLTIDKAAFLLLRVRKVFKKKIQLKKEKKSSNFAQDVVFPKAADIAQLKPARKSRIPPLIRSRTVPAIIVPFSILQAQLVKTAPQTANAPAAAPLTHHVYTRDVYGKSDFSTPGVDYVQFLTGNVGSPPSSSQRHSILPGSGHPSLASRESVSGESSCSWGGAERVSSAGSSDTVNSTPGQSKALGRFARLLNTPADERRKSSTASLHHFHGDKHKQPPSHFQSTLGADLGSWTSYATPRPQRRRRSLEAEDLSRPRAVSIDSLLKNDLAFPSFSLTKRLSTGSASQAKVDASKSYQGLVTAVEAGDVSKVKSFLETCDLDVNSLSLDGLSLLDVAVIQRNGALTKMLLASGATESRQYCKDSISEQLATMVAEAEAKSEDLMARLLKCSTFGNLSSAQLKELEKDFHQWEKRYKKYRNMRSELSHLKPPDPPAKVTVDVVSTTAVRIRFQEADNPDNAICTKYKVEWSLDETFASDSTDSLELFDLRKMETMLSDLETGRRYYVRVSGGNCKGYGLHRNSTPKSFIPSSWRDVDGKKSRYSGKSGMLDEILAELQRARPECEAGSGEQVVTGADTWSSQATAVAQPSVPSVSHRHHSLHGPLPPSLPHANQHKKTQKIISIKQLFASAPKFHKHFKRGIFLSCVVYSEDKLLVTNEEFLPTIEIDETFPSSLHNDFHWLLKVASTWEDVKSFKADMEKSGSASTFHFRLKLLQASAAMQNALGVTDLGRLYYKTIRDKGNSVVVITTVNYMRSTKIISSINARWMPLTKITSRKCSDDVADVLINSIQEQILYHQVSNIPVGRGLYLGYLKLASSMDVLKIVVSEKTPNMLPHAKIRDNPHVSSEEWTLIQKLAKSKSLDSLSTHEQSGGGEEDAEVGGGEQQAGEFSEAQQLFRSQLNTAMKRLFSLLEIDVEASLSHRMYNCEVIEVSQSVSLLVVFPSLEKVCLVAGQSDKLLQRSDLIPLPVQVFEMIHLSTYQKEFITRYARLSAIVEMDTILAQHKQREAFSSSEMATAKQRMTELQRVQAKMDATWKGSRWVMDVVTASRDKSTASASIRALSELDATTSCESVLSGDASVRSDELQLGLHSKSEQQLPQNSGIKFSRSENQLCQLGTIGGSATGNSHTRSHSHPHHHLSGSIGVTSGPGTTESESRPVFSAPTHSVRKVSVPTPYHVPGLTLHDKMNFKASIYSTHSHSDSTISHSQQRQDGEPVSSSSLHNLYRQTSSSQIPVPNVVVSASDASTSHNKQPPPVPPRRSVPPPPADSPANLHVRAFSAVDPPSIPAVSVKLFDSSVAEACPAAAPPVVVIQVFAAYACGLSEGTSVRLQITSQTTARQVVDLLVKQLNAEVKAKGLDTPLYQRTHDFCLVSVIGARERCLRNDFKPLLLQSPWNKGRLYVRNKSDVTAAIDMNSRDSTNL